MLLTGSVGSKKIRDELANGAAQIAVGTHALIQRDVEFADLAVAVVDEQHRFGVEQRKALADGRSPHVLHMTATPIPRTLALTIYGDLAVSEIAKPPANRKPIVTAWVGAERSSDAYARLRVHLDAGRQAYVVCPLIEQSETRLARAAEVEAERLRRAELAGYRVGLLHGKLKTADRREVMRQFKDGELDVLVATTVIEVGIDVPNATIMIVQEADRFGLAQLHQLRGRVGRGAEQSYCLLISRDKLELTDVAQSRLQALVDTTDGFELAEVDLELRGEGQLLGTRQSGWSDLRFTRLRSDRDLIERARALASELATRTARGRTRPTASLRRPRSLRRIGPMRERLPLLLGLTLLSIAVLTRRDRRRPRHPRPRDGRRRHRHRLGEAADHLGLRDLGPLGDEPAVAGGRRSRRSWRGWTKAIRAFLSAQGVHGDELTVQPASTQTVDDDQNQVLGYQVIRNFEVRSSARRRRSPTSRKRARSLVATGIPLQAQPLQYVYTPPRRSAPEAARAGRPGRQNRGKVLARGDRRHRSASCAASTSASSRSTSPNSTEVSDYGVYDTSTLRERRHGRRQRHLRAQLRIIAGTHRGHRIAAPKGRDTRPTSDRVRESAFNLVGPVDDADVLDLFAGSGALGLEALSRGAASARASSTRTARPAARSTRTSTS